MGKESKTSVKIDGKSAACTVLLEGTEIIVRGGHRGKWNVKDMKQLAAKGGVLAFSSEASKVSIELGEQAEKWLDALKNPRSRAQKLGVQTGSKVCVLGDADGEDLSDIEDASGEAISKRMSKSADIVLLFSKSASGLERLSAIAAAMHNACSVWVLWPKGLKDYGHEQAAAAGKAAGLSQTRSVGFSEVYSGLRFVKSKKK